MAANKAQFIAALETAAGISTAEATAATNALPEALGAWMKDNGAGAPGSGTYSGEIADGLKLEMTRTTQPAPHWVVKVTFTAGGLTDYGDGAARFGLAVENA